MKKGRIRVYELANELNLKSTELIKKLAKLGIEVKGSSSSIDQKTAELVKEEIGKKEKRAKTAVLEKVYTRPPVITVMGHVDHGKTTLLDTIRKTNVVAQEVGEITQHIGASRVEFAGKPVVFIDTPGHEAFTAMRARGAQVTDIVVLVVAADEGVMPQTIEAIDHAKAAKVPIIVAINKVDKLEADVEKVKQQLTEQGLVAEEWGGETICVEVSAKEGTGIGELLEMILLVAEMAELRADPEAGVKATIIESELDRTRGAVGTVLVQDGKLRVGDFVVAGRTHGKIRAMIDEHGKRLKEAGPSTPAEILGLTGVPVAGDKLEVVSDEKTAKQIALTRREQWEAEKLSSRTRVRLEDLFQQMQAKKLTELNLILKCDVQGSLEALRQSLGVLDTDEVKINIVHGGMGGISESDIMLASVSDSIVIGFNVRIDPKAQKAAKEEGIDVRLYQIIYDVIDDVKAAMLGKLEPIYEEEIVGRAEVRALFRLSRGVVAGGCYVSSGQVVRGLGLRVIRDTEVVFRGRLTSLRRFKDDVREVSSGYECGIQVDGFNDFQEGDIIEVFRMREVKRG